MVLEDLLKLLIAIGLGGLIGLEREVHDKAAGLRTLMFICAGSTLFTIFSFRLAGSGDTTRIASTIVTGIGFLGAGTIMREGNRVRGLTTAAAIWVVAALGMGIGGGFYGLSTAAALTFLIILWIFPWFEEALARLNQNRTYQITCPLDLNKNSELETYFHQQKLLVRPMGLKKENDLLTITYFFRCSPQKHNILVEYLLKDNGIRSVDYY